MSVSKMQLEVEVDRCLRRFADTLRPAEEYHDMGVRLCDKVLVTLATAVAKTRLIPQDSSSFTMPVAYYAGTVNWYTDPNPQPLEFDILIKIGHRQPPFSDVLDLMDTTLRNNAFRLQISPRTIKMSGYCVYFVFTNGISVTMRPVTMDVGQEEIFRQNKTTAANSSSEIKCRRYYSSNLIDKQIDFIRQQSFYAQKVGRLAKYWYQAMDLQEALVVGGAVMFDLLAIAAVLEEEAKGHGREAILRAFARVVDLTEKLETLAMGFEREYGQYGPWKVKIQSGLNADPNILPRITEPNNPKVNILHGISTVALDGLKINAKAMKMRLTRLMELQEYCEFYQIRMENEGENGGENSAQVAKRQRMGIDFQAFFGVKDESTNNNE